MLAVKRSPKKLVLLCVRPYQTPSTFQLLCLQIAQRSGPGLVSMQIRYMALNAQANCDLPAVNRRSVHAGLETSRVKNPHRGVLWRLMVLGPRFCGRSTAAKRRPSPVPSKLGGL